MGSLCNGLCRGEGLRDIAHSPLPASWTMLLGSRDLQRPKARHACAIQFSDRIRLRQRWRDLSTLQKSPSRYYALPSKRLRPEEGLIFFTRSVTNGSAEKGVTLSEQKVGVFSHRQAHAIRCAIGDLDALYHHARGTPPKRLFWVEVPGGRWRIDWTRTNRSA
jgi:hypothetical protein